jgi:gliding motility-associated-like protein
MSTIFKIFSTISLLLLLAVSSYAQDEFADVVIDAFFVPTDESRIREWYGSDPVTSCREYPMDLDVTTGNTDQWIALPTGSWIVLGFIDNTIINAPNADDIFIDEIGAAREIAIISVSSDFGQTFTELDLINGGTTNTIDLEDYNYQSCVNAIKIEGTDAGGCVPGFDVVRVYGLPGANVASNVITTSICEGEVFDNGTSFDGIGVSGIFQDTFSSVLTGCDSIVTLNLQVGEKYDFIEQEEICIGEEIYGYQESGLYIDTFQTRFFGCDSVRLLELNVIAPASSEQDVTICEGENFDGYTESGRYIDTYDLPDEPCDSARFLNLTVLPAARDVTTVEICEGDSFNGLTEGGEYIQTFEGAAGNGCDSLIVLDLIVIPNGPFVIDRVICEGESAFGQTETGTYNATLTNRLGCDSITQLNLEVVETRTEEVDTTICSGRFVEDYSIPGSYLDTLVSSTGCDSLRTINLSTVREVNVDINASICAGQSFGDFTETGIYRDTFELTEDCDSIVTIDLRVSNIMMPNIFSPNDDGINDELIIGASSDSLLISNYLIYDRWGNLIFEGSSFNARDEAYWWDGTSRGRTVANGVYTYYMTLDCDDQADVPYSGTVTVLR